MSILESDVKLDIQTNSHLEEYSDGLEDNEMDDNLILDFDEEVNIAHRDGLKQEIAIKGNNDSIDEKIESSNPITIILDNNTKNDNNDPKDKEVPKIQNSIKWDEISDINKIELLDSVKKQPTSRNSINPSANRFCNTINYTDRTTIKNNKDSSKLIGTNGKTILSKVTYN